MFWPTKRATSQPYGTCTVLFDSVVKNEDIVVRKFIASPTRVSTIIVVKYLTLQHHHRCKKPGEKFQCVIKT